MIEQALHLIVHHSKTARLKFCELEIIIIIIIIIIIVNNNIIILLLLLLLLTN